MNLPRRPYLAEPANAPPAAEPKPIDWRQLLRRAVPWLCWFYVLTVALTWLLIRFAGDRWWVATMLLFGPRWLLLFPTLVLAPLCAVYRCRWLWGLLAIVIFVAGPLMDLRITRAGLFPPERTPSSIRLLTLNTHFKTLDPLRLRQLIAQVKPDIVALQEWYPENRSIVFSDPSWHTVQLPEALLASPYPIRWDGGLARNSVITAGISYHYTVEMPGRSIGLFSVHLSSPHSAFQDVCHLSRYGPARLSINSRERLREATSLEKASDDDTILMGDCNLPRDSTIYRSAFGAFTDAFTLAGLGYGLTYYSRWTTVRIDHILMGKNWRCRRCWVGPALGSPHRPVIADVERSVP
jgi:vancomycin resistance protein VanJ